METVMILVALSIGGVSVTTQDFDDKAACQNAVKIMSDNSTREIRYSGLCVPKKSK